MSLGCDLVNRSISRISLIAALLVLGGEAAAVGLGDIKGVPALGERPRLQIDILGGEKAGLDSGCFRLKQPGGDTGLPWLRQGTLTLRKGKPPVLEIRSHLPLNEPMLAVAVHVACGYDVTREYVVLASPPSGQALTEMAPLPREADTAPSRVANVERPVAARKAPPPVAPIAAPSVAPAAVPVASKAPEGAPAAVPAPAPADPVAASEEKIRSMEAKVGELQQRAGDLTQKLEQTTTAPPAGETKPAVPPPPAEPVRPPPAADSGSNWTFFAALVAAMLAVIGWVLWRNSRDREKLTEQESLAPAIKVDPQRKGEREERGGAEMEVEPAAMAMPIKLDVKPTAQPAATGGPSRQDSMMSIAAATVDEHFEANPVMELAEIMLSFGRVKGAAQALQEYIDANPQDALKPWLRLMDVYKMGGMRHEYEKVSRELNKHFNVQVQNWEDVVETGGQASVDVVLDGERKSQQGQSCGGLEDMPAILGKVTARWSNDDILDYLNRLLRDNRGGTRVGFPLAVVDDLLFLIDLKEVARGLEGEPAAS
jgi:hypothetical protein